MLQQMRNAQSWMIKGVLMAVVLAFVVGGVLLSFQGVNSGNVPTGREAATILGQRIGVSEFQRVQSSLYQTYQNIFGNRSNIDLREQFNFREMALEQLATRALLLRMAVQENIQVTDAELYDRIAEFSAFQQDGRFDTQRYYAVLSRQVPPIAPKQFEAEQRRDLLTQKIYNLVQAGVQVTEAEVEDAYRQEHEQVAAQFVTLIPSLFSDDVKLTDEDVAAHYEANQARYEEPEQRQIRYVAVPTSRFPFDDEFSPEDIEDYYDGNPDRFTQQEEVRARHILLKIPANADEAKEAEIRTRAEQLLAELKEGADFETLAKANSEDEASAENGGDLGSFPRGRMVPPFEDAAFSLAVGQLSDIVRSKFGFHILRVDDRIEAGVKDLDAVRDEIIEALRKERMDEAALTFVDDVMVTLEDDPEQFEAVAESHDLAVVTPPFTPRTGRIEKLEPVATLVPRVFELNERAVEAVSGPDGTQYIFQLIGIQEPAVKPLEEVKDQVTEDLGRQKRNERAHQTAEDWAAQVQAGTALNEVAETRGVQIVETGSFKRNDPVPQYGRSAAFSQTVFDLQVGDASAVHDGQRHAVVQVTERQDADMTGYEEAKDGIRQQLLTQKRQRARAALDSHLRAQYQQLRQDGEIVVNPQYVF